MNQIATNAMPADPLSTVSQIANQNDRYLFLLLLGIAGFCAWRCVKWLVAKLEASQSAQAKQMAEQMADLKIIIAEQRGVIEKNTKAFEDLKSSIDRLREDMLRREVPPHVPIGFPIPPGSR